MCKTKTKLDDYSNCVYADVFKCVVSLEWKLDVIYTVYYDCI